HVMFYETSTRNLHLRQLAIPSRARPFAPPPICARMDRAPKSNSNSSASLSPRTQLLTHKATPPMTYAQMILPEFDHEMANTRKVLERVPEDKLDWKAHPKSNTIGWNANHLAELPGWSISIATEPGYDFAPVGGKRYESPNFTNRRELLEFFDRNV